MNEEEGEEEEEEEETKGRKNRNQRLSGTLKESVRRSVPPWLPRVYAIRWCTSAAEYVRYAGEIISPSHVTSRSDQIGSWGASRSVHNLHNLHTQGQPKPLAPAPPAPPAPQRDVSPLHYTCRTPCDRLRTRAVHRAYLACA